jgi:hypothetical protein
MKWIPLLFAVILSMASAQTELAQTTSPSNTPSTQADPKAQAQQDKKATKPKKVKSKPLAKVNTTPDREAAVDMTRPTKQNPPPK